MRMLADSPRGIVENVYRPCSSRWTSTSTTRRHSCVRRATARQLLWRSARNRSSFTTRFPALRGSIALLPRVPRTVLHTGLRFGEVACLHLVTVFTRDLETEARVCADDLTLERPREEGALQSGSIGKAEWDSARDRVSELTADLEAHRAHERAERIELDANAGRMQAQMRMLQTRVSDADVRAPQAGVVLARYIEPGLREFLVAGLRYVFPARLGLLGQGMPTAFSLSPLADKLRLGEDDGIVWLMTGKKATRARGRVIEPLYRTAPLAAEEDPVLHEYLALADTLRIGRARERAMASEELVRRLS